MKEKHLSSDKDFLQEMPIKLANKYKKPFVITFCCLPGSGTTDIARVLSKKLKIYLLSNDYVRNYYYQFCDDYSEENRLKINDMVHDINNKRLLKLVNNDVSFVFDRCMNKEEDYQKLKELLTDKYDIIRIKIVSNDIDNINKIHSREMDYNKKYDGVIGDNVEYLSNFPDNVYYEIKERIPMLLDDASIDFIIKNNDDEIENIIEYIKENKKNASEPSEDLKETLKELEEIESGKKKIKGYHNVNKFVKDMKK